MREVIKRIIVCCILVPILAITLGQTKVQATEHDDNVLLAGIYISGYTVTNESIIPGLDFTLTVTLINNHAKTVENILVNIENPAGVIPEYGTVTQAYIERIAPKSSEEISFHYTTEASIQGTSLNFTASILVNGIARAAQLRVPLSRTTDFMVEKVVLPETYLPGKIGYASAVITNTGYGDISNTILKIMSGGNEIASTNVGTMAAGNTKTQSVSISFEKEGEYDLRFVLEYTDHTGTEKEYLLASAKAVVKEGETAVEMPSNTGMNEWQEEKATDDSVFNNMGVIVACGMVLVVLCITILVLIFKRK